MAQQHRRVAAAVLEHQHLAAGVQRSAHRAQQLRRQAGVERALANVQHAHHGRLGIAGALAQAQLGVAAGLRVVQGLQRRRGAAQQHRHVQRLAAHQREIAGVVADAVLLLVAAVVFLIDHDQPGLGQRREHRGSGADDHPRLAAPGGGPDAGALGIAQAGMQRMHGHAEPLAEPRQRLRREADLRHQHQRLAAAGEAVGDGVEVHLGLAAAGHAVEQPRGEARTGAQGVQRRGLFVVEHRPGLRQRRALRGRHRHAFGQVALQQGAGGAAPVVQRGVELVFVQRHPVHGVQKVRQLSRPSAQAGQAGGAGFGQPPRPGVGVGQNFAATQGAGQRGGQHFAQRGVGVSRQPAQRLQQFALQQRLRVQHRLGLAQLGDTGLGRTHADHHPDHAAAAERHAHPAAHFGRPIAWAIARRQIVEQTGQWHRQGDAEDGISDGHGGGHGRQSTESAPGGIDPHLRRIAAGRDTNDPQVADRKGNSALSTQAVDKFVHDSMRELFCAVNPRVPRCMAKKAPPHETR